ncbi:hypothetical protein HIDPHFAB_01479 [Nocardioides sp. T2.26MG-1]|nr:hypothetical protein HIDPHFAB_01479 [Nocardioides sp. T2.26MG-1]
MEELPTGSVIGTGHPKAPCDSYSRGAFTHFPTCCPQAVRRPQPRRRSTEPRAIPRPAWRRSRRARRGLSAVGIQATSVDDRAPICGGPGQFRWNQQNVARIPCAVWSRGHRTLSRTPARESGTARRRGSTRCRTSLLGQRRGGWVTRPLGPEWKGCRSGASPVPITRRAPCDSYSRGALHLFRPPTPRPPGERTRRLGGHPACRCADSRSAGSRSAVGIWAISVDDRAPICGGPGQFRWNQQNVARIPCAVWSRGHRTLSRTPARESGTARRRGSTRCRTSLLGQRRGGWVTRPLGPEWKGCRSGASPVPITRRALGTHTFEGPSPISPHHSGVFRLTTCTVGETRTL